MYKENIQPLESHVVLERADCKPLLIDKTRLENAFRSYHAPWINDFAWYRSSDTTVKDVIYIHLHCQSPAQLKNINNLTDYLITSETLDLGGGITIDLDGGAKIADQGEVFQMFPQLNRVFIGNVDFLNDYLIARCQLPSISDSAFDQLKLECKRESSLSSGEGIVGLAYSDQRTYSRVFKVTNDQEHKVDFSFCRGLCRQLQRIQLMNNDPRISAYRIHGDVYILIEWNPYSKVVNEVQYQTAVNGFIHSKAEPLCREAGVVIEDVQMARIDMAIKLGNTPLGVCTVIYPNEALEGQSDYGDDNTNDNEFTLDQHISRCHRIKAGYIVQPHLATVEQCAQLEGAIRTKSNHKVKRMNVYNSSDGSTQLLYFYGDPQKGGFHRQYFTMHAGSTILKEQGLTVTKFKDCKNEETEFFRQFNVIETFYGDDEVFRQYANRIQGEEKIRSSNEETSIVNRLMSMYQGLLLKGENVTVEQFRHRHRSDTSKYRIIVKEEKLFTTIYNDSFKEKLVQIPRVDPIVRVRDFCKKNPLLTYEQTLTTKFLANIQLLEAVEAIFKCVVLKENIKRGGVLLYGPPNTGKSRMLEFLAEIFTAVKQLPNKSSFDGVPPDLPEAPQVVLIEEAALAKYIKDVEGLKVFLERKGIGINIKNRNPVHMYEGASVVMATNEISEINTLKGNDKEAIDYRLYTVNMTKQFRHMKFPISVRQLAHYFLASFDNQLKQSTDSIEEEEAPQRMRLMPDSITKPKKLLGKRTRYNSTKVEEKTRREIDWKRQATLDKHVVIDLDVDEDNDEGTTLPNERTAANEMTAIEIEDSDNEVQEIELEQVMKEQFFVTHMDKLKVYYETVFPYKTVASLYAYQMDKREFAYCVFNEKQGKDLLVRFKSFPRNEQLLKKYFTQHIPFNITNGAIYDRDLSKLASVEERKSLVWKYAELNFDIDLNDHDRERECGCQGKTMCNCCWQDFIAPVVEFLDTCLREKCRFKKILWTLSGSRGVHCRVFDDEATALSKEARVLLLEFIKVEAEQQNVNMKLDEGVTKNPKGLLRMPMTIHHRSERLVVPFLASEVRQFDLEVVPTLDDIIRDKKRVNSYQDLLYKFNKTLFSHPPQQFKESDGYKYILTATGQSFRVDQQAEVETGKGRRQASSGETSNVWQSKVNQGADQQKYDRKFFSQVHKEKKYGHLHHDDRVNIIYGFHRRHVPMDDAIAFFKETMGEERYQVNDIDSLIRYAYGRQLKSFSNKKFTLKEILALCANQKGLSDTEDEMQSQMK